MTQMRDENIAAFIGPDESCTSEALIASAWNIPMISFVSWICTYHSDIMALCFWYSLV